MPQEQGSLYFMVLTRSVTLERMAKEKKVQKGKKKNPVKGGHDRNLNIDREATFIEMVVIDRFVVLNSRNRSRHRSQVSSVV